jgi:hypothetical protein
MHEYQLIGLKLKRYSIYVVVIIANLFLNKKYAQSTCATTKSGLSAQCNWTISKIVDRESPSNSVNPAPGTDQFYFTFDSFSKYLSGITITGGTILKLIVADDTTKSGVCDFKLCMSVSNFGATGDEWKTEDSYGSSTSAPKPTIGFLKIRVDNACHTPKNYGQWQEFSNDGDTFGIIDQAGSTSTTATSGCGFAAGTEVNGAGTYLGPDYGEMTFVIDYKITPKTTGGALSLAPGLYKMSIRYCLTEDD